MDVRTAFQKIVWISTVAVYAPDRNGVRWMHIANVGMASYTGCALVGLILLGLPK